MLVACIYDTAITRAGYYDDGTTNSRVIQDYYMAYDAFGNTTGISVGNADGTYSLSTSQYADYNGVLQKQTYGNGDYTTFTYDDLGRSSETSTSDGDRYTYTYTGDGQLSVLKDLTDGLVYRFNYDTLGRLINSSADKNGTALLQTWAEYDENSRLIGQSWQLEGDETYSEGYVYDDHGRLTSKSVTLPNGTTSTVTNGYDSLSRLSTQTGPVSKATYTYLAGANSGTTGLVSSVAYSKVNSNSFTPFTFTYTYDNLGNILTAAQTGKSTITYKYDQQGQLTSVDDPDNGLVYTFKYDTYGNIRSASAWGTYNVNGSYENTYAYDDPYWRDLLTAFNDEKIAYEGQTFNATTGTVTGTPTSGNPISYFNGTRWSFDWKNGRELSTATMTDSTGLIDTVVTYEYDINGLRTGKTVTMQTYEAAPAHSYTATVVAPTCTDDGYTLYVCACGDSYQDTVVDALGHNYVASNGVNTCTRCGDTYTDHTHSYTTTVVAPTCTEDGYTLYECSCGYSYEDNIVNALRHDYVIVGQTEDTITRRCTRCGHTITETAIPVDPPVSPPVEGYGLRSGTAPSEACGGTERALVSTTTESHEYIYASGQLLRETITTTDEDGNATTQTLDFTYDANGNPYTLSHTSGTTTTTYYYITNPQGDVVRLVDTTGATVAQYSYDPWGKLLSVSDTSSTQIANRNPLRYRGYYYDTETSFYYLQSRYYDPTICRFINADILAYTGQGFLGYNMFAYCLNNPTNSCDHSGTFCLDAAVELLARWLFYAWDSAYFDSESAIGKALSKSEKMENLAIDAIENYNATGKDVTTGDGEFTSDEDGWNLYLSTQHFNYIAEVQRETKSVEEHWMYKFFPDLFATPTVERFTVTIYVIDTYNFDDLRSWSSLGNILNNIAYEMNQYGVGHDYIWVAEYSYVSEWSIYDGN